MFVFFILSILLLQAQYAYQMPFLAEFMLVFIIYTIKNLTIHILWKTSIHFTILILLLHSRLTVLNAQFWWRRCGFKPSWRLNTRQTVSTSSSGKRLTLSYLKQGYMITVLLQIMTLFGSCRSCDQLFSQCASDPSPLLSTVKATVEAQYLVLGSPLLERDKAIGESAAKGCV